ncbi:MAG: hypothetical protein ACOC3X_02095 [Nanoarchaeota archaeon]
MNNYNKAENLCQKALKHIAKYKINKPNGTFSINYDKINTNDYLKMLSCYFASMNVLKKDKKIHVKDKADLEYKLIPEVKRQINHLKEYKNKEDSTFYLLLINNPMPKKAQNIKKELENMMYVKTQNYN